MVFDEGAVLERVAWPVLDHAELLARSPGGALVVRLDPGDEPEPGASWVQRVDAVRRQPYLGFAAWLQVRSLLTEHGRLPCVATVCGSPVLLADLVSFVHAREDLVELGLESPGEWSTLLHARRLVTAPGPPWLVLGAQPYLGRARLARQRGEPVRAGRSTTWTRWA